MKGWKAFQPFSVNYGLGRKSILSKFPGFQVTEQLPQDLMHILLEGVIPDVVKCLLQYYISKDLITVDQINSRLMEFGYGYSQVKDKPEPINPESLKDKPGKHICKDAAKMWMLFRILPFILHDIIDDSEEPFRVFELLMNISSLLLAPVISYENISFLQRLTKQFLMDFKNFFNKQIIPEMHYLIHCTRLILLCGPLVKLWNMRFEGKHKDFKKIAKKMQVLRTSLFPLPKVSKDLCWQTLLVTYFSVTCICKKGPQHFLEVKTLLQPNSILAGSVMHLKSPLSRFVIANGSLSMVQNTFLMSLV